MSEQPKSCPPGGDASTSSSSRGERLDSWKAIAAFLGRDLRTVQRWEVRDGLPVRRLPHGTRDAVHAFTAELDEWRNRTWRESGPPRGGASGKGHSPIGERLESWKAVAAYLQREVRTVQRWEDEDGLPVHRLPHGTRDAIYAFTGELDAWRAALPTLGADQVPAEPVITTVPAREPLRGSRLRVFAFAAAALLLAATMLVAEPWSPYRRIASGMPPEPLPFGARFFAASTNEGGHAPYTATTVDIEPVATSPEGETVYVAGQGQLVLFAAADLRVLRRVPIRGTAKFVKVSPNGRQLYVSFYDRSSLVVINTPSDNQREIELGGVPYALALTPDGAQLYVALPYAGLARIDTTTLAETRIPLPPCPAGLAMAPDGRHLYVSFQCGGPGGRSGHDVVAVLDLASGTLSPLLREPPFIGGGLALTPDGTQLWVGSNGACTLPQYDHVGCPRASGDPVYVVDPIRGNVESVLKGTVASVSFSPGGDRAIAVDGNVIDVSRGTVLEQMPLHRKGVGFSWSPDGRALYVSNGGALAAFRASPAACSPPLRDLRNWWPGDGAPNDAFGVDNGTASPGVEFAPGRAGQAFRFYGGGVDLGPATSLDLLDRRQGPTTLVAWAKFDAASDGGQPLASRVSSDGRRGWLLQRDAHGRLSVCVTGRCVAGRTSLAPGVWYHIAAEMSADHVALFVNAQPDGDGWLDTTTGAVPGAQTYLGADPLHALRFQGLLDEVMLYGGGLGSQDLRQLMQIPECLQQPR